MSVTSSKLKEMHTVPIYIAFDENWHWSKCVIHTKVWSLSLKGLQRHYGFDFHVHRQCVP